MVWFCLVEFGFVRLDGLVRGLVGGLVGVKYCNYTKVENLGLDLISIQMSSN